MSTLTATELEQIAQVVSKSILVNEKPYHDNMQDLLLGFKVQQTQQQHLNEEMEKLTKSLSENTKSINKLVSEAHSNRDKVSAAFIQIREVKGEMADVKKQVNELATTVEVQKATVAQRNAVENKLWDTVLKFGVPGVLTLVVLGIVYYLKMQVSG